MLTITGKNGDIRLIGISPLQGRVEVCYDRVWGNVCNSPWHSMDAVVVCRQLGYATSGMNNNLLTLLLKIILLQEL